MTRAMRFPLGAMLLAGLAGCGSMEYKDNYQQIANNPLCAGSDPSSSMPAQTRNCDREQGMNWSSEHKGEPVDFGGGKDKDKDR